MAGPDPTLIKANPPAGSGGQPPTSQTSVEVTHHVESELDSSITESKTESTMESPPITPSATVRNLSYTKSGFYRLEFLTRLFNVMCSL